MACGANVYDQIAGLIILPGSDSAGTLPACPGHLPNAVAVPMCSHTWGIQPT